MPDIWFDVDAALAEVPVNKFPLIDDTDFKTRETAVAYNAAGMDLVWNFVTSSGAYTQTAVTPTTGGTYDWAHQGDGMYSIEIPASGGASINNNTEGYGWFTGIATGVLAWASPIFGFRAAAINDSLCDTNTTGLLAPTTAGRTLDVTAGGNAGIDLDNVALTNGCGPVAVAASGTLSGTHSSTTADLGANAPTSGEVAGMTLRIPGKFFSRVITSYNTGTGVATFDSTVITLEDGDQWYLSDTPDMPAAALQDIADAILTRQMTESYAADGVAPTLAQALLLIQQSIGDFSVSGTTLTVNQLDGSTAAATYTLDSATAPTSRTRAT